jgi:hypothetical protein
MDNIPEGVAGLSLRGELRVVLPGFGKKPAIGCSVNATAAVMLHRASSSIIGSQSSCPRPARGVPSPDRYQEFVVDLSCW